MANKNPTPWVTIESYVVLIDRPADVTDAEESAANCALADFDPAALVVDRLTRAFRKDPGLQLLRVRCERCL